MELKKQGQILSLLLDERFVSHQTIVNWVDDIIRESEGPKDWATQISISIKENTDHVVYMLWSHFGYEYHWPFTEYVALISYFYQKERLPLHNCIIHLHHLTRDFYPAHNDKDSFMFKEHISYFFTMLDDEECDDGCVAKIVEEFDDLIQQAQSKHNDSIGYITNLIEYHSGNIPERYWNTLN